MNKILFYKYQGTGNDFVITTDLYEPTAKQIQFLCNRKYGIGADGLIVMKQDSDVDFDMMYYNADGSESFCGNGSRCAVMHAKYLNWIDTSCHFNSNDGTHYAEVEDDLVRLKMHDVDEIKPIGDDFETNTGSPHYLIFKDSLDIPVVEEAQKIRFNETYKEKGINVNFLKPEKDCLRIRTYERGVEDETLSCGTGVTAAVLAEFASNNAKASTKERVVSTQGGDLAVRFTFDGESYKNIYLIGPAVRVFKGEILLTD
jgi:diaminopimelate epimerase